MALDILDIVELSSQRIVDVDDNNLPVGLLLVQQSHHAEDLDLLDLARVANQLTDLTNVKRVVVALGLGLGVDAIRVFPRLVLVSMLLFIPSPSLAETYLREGTVVPEITLVGEAVTDIPQLALLDILLDGVEEFLLRDLGWISVCFKI